MDPNGEWGRKIIEVYMTWYTFFVTTNFAAMGYLFTKDFRNLEARGIRLFAGLFILLNLLGCGSTIMVGRSTGRVAPPEFGQLIHWAAVANTIGLLANVACWVYIFATSRGRS
jgi:hypothetical protein